MTGPITLQFSPTASAFAVAQALEWHAGQGGTLPDRVNGAIPEALTPHYRFVAHDAFDHPHWERVSPEAPRPDRTPHDAFSLDEPTRAGRTGPQDAGRLTADPLSRALARFNLVTARLARHRLDDLFRRFWDADYQVTADDRALLEQCANLDDDQMKVDARDLMRMILIGDGAFSSSRTKEFRRSRCMFTPERAKRP